MRSGAAACSAAGGGSQRRRARATLGSGGAHAARPAQERRLRALAQDGTACARGRSREHGGSAEQRAAQASWGKRGSWTGAGVAVPRVSANGADGRGI
jgi:hypothetical protein